MIFSDSIAKRRAIFDGIRVRELKFRLLLLKYTGVSVTSLRRSQRDFWDMTSPVGFFFLGKYILFSAPFQDDDRRSSSAIPTLLSN